LAAVGLSQVLCKMWGITRQIIVFLVFGFSLGCSENKEMSPEDTGINYFPLEVGHYKIYEVHGVEYINPEDSILFSYQLKETVVGSFQNLEDGISYKLLREIRGSNEDVWKTDSIWTARKDKMRAIRTENNVPIISLVFPLQEKKTWDGNGLNRKDEDQFQMINVGEVFAGDFQSFDRTVSVIQEDIPANFVNFISKKEVYGEGMGLIYKENIHLEYLQGEFTNLGLIKSGLKYYQSMIDSGNE